jgi:hypothetical protein
VLVEEPLLTTVVEVPCWLQAIVKTIATAQITALETNIKLFFIVFLSVFVKINNNKRGLVSKNRCKDTL